jgi:hypothetical protein
MALSPLSHPLDIFRPAKVTTILRLILPPGLSSGLTCLAAFRFSTVALSAAIVRARKKKLSAMEALA